MPDYEPVTSPDQRKPGHPRAARLGATVIALVLVALIFGNDNENSIATVFLSVGAALLLVVVIGDWVLRRHGLH
ncbi:hypothetical protein AB0M46_34425 [Dactylosporangium sp. NPDC051485]|uniref:hypothetical protein n=1 Tax=Dactylosporangium sp. NPDC051485 TaxID=3154846 RepID=UPI00342C8A52